MLAWFSTTILLELVRGRMLHMRLEELVGSAKENLTVATYARTMLPAWMPSFVFYAPVAVEESRVDK